MTWNETIRRAIDVMELPRSVSELRTYSEEIARVLALEPELCDLAPAVAMLEQAIEDLTAADAAANGGPLAARHAVNRDRRVIRGFRALLDPDTGAVTLLGRTAARPAVYCWAFSADDGRTWNALPPTLRSRTEAPRFDKGTVVQFRYRAVTQVGSTSWCGPIALFVT